jgi:hypothetical protein
VCVALRICICDKMGDERAVNTWSTSKRREKEKEGRARGRGGKGEE